ncbi:MAG: pyridoxal phosphate-dependent aminotransferase [Bryobacterales bacterium]|nr:pyridoxal phosphate-dependent aminotransferase [Bryobacterales bacterium]
MAAIVTAQRIQLLRPTAVNSILAEVRQLQARGQKLISLMRGEPDFRTPPHIVEAAQRALRNGRTAYPDNRGEPALREAVAEKLLRDNGLRYDPGREILITSGATFGIHAAFTALLNPGDEVILPEPLYDAYHSPALLAGGTVRTVAARIYKGRFTLDAAAIDAACTERTRVLLLNTPWNPTGAVFTAPELAAIGEIVTRRNLVLVADEIYEAITYGAPHISPAALSPELRARTVLLNSFSKTYAMTGWRIGYCAAPPELIQAMFLALQQSSRGPATFVQDAGVEALRGPRNCVAQMREEYARRRSLVCERLTGLAGCRVLAPEGGFFAMLDITPLGQPSNEVRRRLLNEHGVVVVHGSAYGAAGENTLRLSFASGGETLAQGLERLRTAFEVIR